MGSSETSQKKISTQELFGDILGEVESAWEKRKQAGSASSATPQAASESTAPDSSEVETAAFEPQAAELPTPEPSMPEPPTPESAEEEPPVEAFTAPDPNQELAENGHQVGSDIPAPNAPAPDSAAASPAVSEAAPSPSTATPKPSAPEASEVAAARAEITSAETTRTETAETAELEAPPVAPGEAAAEASATTVSPTAELPKTEASIAAQTGTAESEPATDPMTTNVEVRHPSMPWLEEHSPTNWARLSAMAAVVGLIGLGVWWFALRPADTATNSEPPAVVTEPADSFIAGIEEQGAVPAQPQGAVNAEDEVTALVEPPAGDPPTVGVPGQLDGDAAVERPAASTEPAQSGPTTAELEAMIATRVAAQERRLRADLDEQRRILEEKIARLEAANAAEAEEPTAEGQTADSQSEAEVQPEAASPAEPEADPAAGEPVVSPAGEAQAADSDGAEQG